VCTEGPRQIGLADAACRGHVVRAPSRSWAILPRKPGLRAPSRAPRPGLRRTAGQGSPTGGRAGPSMLDRGLSGLLARRVRRSPSVEERVQDVEALIVSRTTARCSPGWCPRGRGGARTWRRSSTRCWTPSRFRFSEEDVLFESWVRRQEFPGGAPVGEECTALRAAFFLAKQRPCLRASPLPMRYGWGLAFDHAGAGGAVRRRLAGVPGTDPPRTAAYG
jgi:hypothetical protein